MPSHNIFFHRHPIRIRAAAVMAMGWAMALGSTLSLAQPLPPAALSALKQAQVPPEALSVWIAPTRVGSQPIAAHRDRLAMNPASVMKLVTTYAALELLGPAHTWTTTVIVDGSIRPPTLHGSLWIRGGGDPKLVIERLWLLLSQVQGLGIQQIDGDLILDTTRPEGITPDPAAFDGEPYRPYNASPESLLVNFKSVVLRLTPHPESGQALVQMEPQLAQVQVPAGVRLANGPCTDWRSQLQADFSNPNAITFWGTYPALCGERTWPVAYGAPEQYAQRVVSGLWQAMGGRISGQVRNKREGEEPASERALVLKFNSPTLAEVVRDTNKFSNNLMAQHIFLSLGPAFGANSSAQPSFEQSRQTLKQWWLSRWPDQPPPVLENGSGLSRVERITAQGLGRMLQTAWASPVMSELMASLAVMGVDGTLRLASKRLSAGVSAHLKTGSLKDVVALAGYVDASDGQRFVLVAIINHPKANQARGVLDALVNWTASQPP